MSGRVTDIIAAMFRGHHKTLLTLLAGGLLLPACTQMQPDVAEPPAAEVVEPAPEPAQTEVEPEPAPAEAGPAEAGPEPAPVVTEPPPASGPAYNREDVLWIQQRLQDLGYYSGAIDGSVGQATREAVRAYQRDQDIAADGRPTAELREFMWRNGG